MRSVLLVTWMRRSVVSMKWVSMGWSASTPSLLLGWIAKNVFNGVVNIGYLVAQANLPLATSGKKMAKSVKTTICNHGRELLQMTGFCDRAFQSYGIVFFLVCGRFRWETDQKINSRVLERKRSVIVAESVRRMSSHHLIEWFWLQKWGQIRYLQVIDWKEKPTNIMDRVPAGLISHIRHRSCHKIREKVAERESERGRELKGRLICFKHNRWAGGSNKWGARKAVRRMKKTFVI